MQAFITLAGTNYTGSSNALRGCLNDMDDGRTFFTSKGFTILNDVRGKDLTTANWKEALLSMRSKINALTGPVLVGHMHSHHGTQLPDLSEADGLKEVWVPEDFDWSPERCIDDDWMAEYVKGYRAGVCYFDWADCCHAADSLRAFRNKNELPRFMPNPELSAERVYVSHPMVVTGEDHRGILLAACRSDQTSADALIDGRYCGAFTNAMLRAIRNTSGGISYASLIMQATRILELRGFTQRPELDCPGEWFDALAFDTVP